MSKQQFVGQWTSSHVHGDCLVNHEHKLYYINIPKCASSWFKKFIAKMPQAWTGGNFLTDSLDGYRAIVALRDPVKRWASACPARVKINSINFELIQNCMEDEHTNPQTNFLVGADVSQAIYFWCDQNMSAKVEHFLQSQGIVTPVVSWANVSEDPDLVQDQQRWTSALNDPVLFSQFKQLFANDYDFIANTKFYLD